MAESIGFGIAVQRFGGQFFKHGTRLSGLLKHPKRLDDQVQKRIVRSWERAHSGVDNAHKIALLEEGMDWVQLGVPPEDAQFLESRNFSRSEIAGIYRVPPHMIGDLRFATYSNIEEQGIEFVIYCLTPWLKRIEGSANVNLLGPKERFVYYTEHLVDALLRGNSEARNKAYSTGVQWGWYSPNDIREKENENPRPGGDVYWMAMNMVPSSGSKPPEKPKGEPEGEPPEEGAEPENEEVKQLRLEWREIIQKRSVENRGQIRKTYHRLFKDAAKRLVRKEVKMLKTIIRKTLQKGKLDEFRDAIKELYDKFNTDITKILGPTSMSYAEQIHMATELEFEAEQKSENRAALYCTCEEKRVTLDLLMEHYEKAYVKVHVARSTEAIDGLMAAEAVEELPGKLEKMLDKWDAKRPEQIAIREIVKIDGFVARSTFFGLGAKKVKWVRSEKETSAFCRELHGKTTTINQPFLEKGDVLAPKGAKSPMDIKNRYYHPPLYRGCECSIVME